MVPNISVKDLLSNNCKNIIDIRSIENYNNNHIPNSINIPFEKIISTPSNFLNKNEMYYIYCRSGITSKKVCEILKKMGYNVTNILGGYEEWLLTK